MSGFNQLINGESNYLSSKPWVSSNNSTIDFYDATTEYDDLYDQSKPWDRFSGQNLNYILEHRNDRILHIGYDYRGKVLKRTLSKVMFIEKKREAILNEIEKIVDFLIDSVKHIKKAYNYALEKNYRDFN